MKIHTFLLSLLFSLVSPFASAAEESPFSGEAYHYHYQGSDGSYWLQGLYVEHSLTESLSAWGSAYRESDGRVLYAGFAKTWSNGLTIGLGGGQSRYDRVTQDVVASFVSYSSDAMEGFALFERYEGESSLYYQASAQWYYGENLFGLYAEKDFGIGPMLTWNLTERFAISGAVPLIDRVGTNIMVSATVTF